MLELSMEALQGCFLLPSPLLAVIPYVELFSTWRRKTFHRVVYLTSYNSVGEAQKAQTHKHRQKQKSQKNYNTVTDVTKHRHVASSSFHATLQLLPREVLVESTPHPPLPPPKPPSSVLWLWQTCLFPEQAGATWRTECI